MAPLIGMCDIIDSGYSCFAKRADIMSSAICDNVIERTSGASGAVHCNRAKFAATVLACAVFY